MTHKLGSVAPLKMDTKGKKYPPKKSHPKGIDPAYPNKNFVRAHYDNVHNGEGWMEYMYGGQFHVGNDTPIKKSSGFGHSIGQRAGKLRTSGNPNAHRIGRRTK